MNSSNIRYTSFQSQDCRIGDKLLYLKKLNLCGVFKY
ncbi:hypothetical protein EFZG_03968, partial [Enterococcus faecium TC 6]